MMENKNMFETTIRTKQVSAKLLHNEPALISIVSMASVDSTWKLNSV